MLRTALLTLVLLFAGFGAANWLTHDFAVWTAEGARRLEVERQPAATPAVEVDGPGIAPQPLPQLLAATSKVSVVDFIYTRCQTVCLTLGSTFQQMQARLQADGPTRPHGVQLMSISFDSAHDTPEALAAYAGRLHADPALWRFVRVPDAAQLQTLLRRFQVVVVPDVLGDYQHNGALLVVDANGRLVRIFDYSEQQLALDFARYLASGSPS
ncbi:MAG: SCO family protein [Burkholderiaceae bacterium]